MGCGGGSRDGGVGRGVGGGVWGVLYDGSLAIICQTVEDGCHS